MRRSTYLLLAGLLATALATPAGAQKIQFKSSGQPPIIKATRAEKAARQKAFAAQYPLLAQRHSLKPSEKAPFKEVSARVPLRQSFVKKVSDRLQAGSAPTFWDIIAFDGSWGTDDEGNNINLGGLYSFTADATAAHDSLLINSYLANQGGSGIQDGIYYHLSVDMSWASWGLIFMNLYSYDFGTWEPTATNGESIDDYSLIAMETAQAQDGTTYGEFYTADLTGIEYGTIDYAAKTRTTIGTASTTMVALGVTSDNRLYGIGTDGNLYQISTSDGTETLIGATGLTLADDEGYYGQTGEIDPKTNTFYWEAIDVQGNAGLYTVDLATGAATQIADQGDFQAYDMMPEGKLAEDGAPAKIDDLAVSFDGPSTSGTATFTLPTVSYAGDPLSGELTYSVSVNGSYVGGGTSVPGTVVTYSFTDLAEGNTSFVVSSSNDAGMSPRAKVSKYIGYDTPSAPANVTLSVDENNLATVTWNPVTTGINAGYIDADAVTYDVIRLGGDTTVVASGASDTTIVDQLPTAAMTNYTYAVCAHNASHTSIYALSNGVVVGSAYETPYFEDFLTYDAFQIYTVIDGNGDGRTWDYNYMSAYSRGGSAYYNYSSDNAGDDWLVTPPIHLKPGRDYIVSFSASGSSSYYPERFEAKLGTAPTADALTTEVIPSTDIASGDFQTFSNTIQVTADGNYYLGIHAISDADMYRLYIDSISIKADALATSPAAPGLTVTPGDNGDLNAIIDVQAPTQAINGDALTSITRIDVLRNGTVIRSFDNPTPGETNTFINSVPADGSYKYSATAYIGDEYGKTAEASAFIGMDAPAAPANAEAIDGGTTVTINYDLPEVGANGGYVDNSTMTTYLYNLDDQGYVESNPTDSVTGGASFSFAFNTNEGDPDLKTWALSNKNRAGESGFVGASIPVGAPATLPFRESVNGGQLTYSWWISRQGGSQYTNTWAYTTDDAADNDGGSFVYSATADGVSGNMNTYKVSLEGAASPQLIFSDKLSGLGETSAGRAFVQVQTPDGQLHEVFTETIDGNRDWTQHKADLSAFTGYQWVIVKFNVQADVNPINYGLDKIIIQDVYDDDLSIALSAPEGLLKGQPANAYITVTNEGNNAAASYHVNVYADDAIAKSVDFTDELGSFDAKSFSVSIPTSSLNEKSELNIRAEVVYDGDLDDTNNSASANVALSQANVPAPENLTSTAANDSVNLAWQAPAIAGETITDDFEAYTAWALDEAGNWDFYNGDEGIFGSLTQSGSEPNAGATAAYEIWKPGDVFSAGQGLDPHSGDQCLASIYKINAAGDAYADADDWAISPQLSGLAQTVTFWVNNVNGNGYGAETFQVLASTTDNDPESFTQVGDNYTQSSAEWTEISVDLPEGTRYFAIRRITSGAEQFIFLIDDVTYQSGASVESYNVYRDGELIGNTADTEFADVNAADANHSYSVTAVYNDGSESAPATVDFVSGIEGIQNGMNAKSYDVYTVGGAQVKKDAKTLNGLGKGVYLINGKKVLVK